MNITEGIVGRMALWQGCSPVPVGRATRRRRAAGRSRQRYELGRWRTYPDQALLHRSGHGGHDRRRGGPGDGKPRARR
jgi:hypothetical protein